VTPPASTIKKTLRPDNTTVEPLGFYRLQLLSIFDTLLLLNYQSVVMEIVENATLLPSIMETFFRFEHNTFCHKIVERFFVRVMQQIAIFGMDPSKILGKTRLIERLMEVRAEAKACEAAKKATKQYVPFTYNIGETLNKICETDESLKEVLEKIAGWKEYVEFLVERRTKLDAPPVIEQGGGGKSGSGEDATPTFESIANESEPTPAVSSYGEGRDADDDRFALADTEDMPSEDDADDYDVEQAEILLTKQEVQALA